MINKFLVTSCLFYFVKCNNDLGKQCDLNNITDITTHEVTRISTACKNKKCIIRACDDINSIMLYNNKTITCKSIEEVSKIVNKSIVLPSVYKYDGQYAGQKSVKNILNDFKHVQYVDRNVLSSNCTQNWNSENPEESRNFYIMEDGCLLIEAPNDPITLMKFGNGLYILEIFVRRNSSTREWNGPLLKIKMFNSPLEQNVARDKYYITGMAVSSLFLVLTLVVQIFFMEWKLTNFMNMTHVFCLANFFGIQSGQMFALFNNMITSAECRVICAIWYFWWLASFFWMNVMAIELFVVFCGKYRATRLSLRKALRRFGLYAIWAMVMPLLITIFAIVLDEIDLPRRTVIVKPSFSDCFPSPARKPYMYIPIGIILFCNIVLYIFTTVKIIRQRNSNEFETSDSRRTKRNTSGIIIYTKLMVVMGVNWILDLVDLFVQLPAWLIDVLNYNIWIGIAIFAIYICDRNLIDHIRRCKRINPRQTLSSKSRQTSTTGLLSKRKHDSRRSVSSTALSD